jgi:hypothetical protein
MKPRSPELGRKGNLPPAKLIKNSKEVRICICHALPEITVGKLSENRQYLATNWAYRWSGENCRYGMDMGTFWRFDKFLRIAAIFTGTHP